MASSAATTGTSGSRARTKTRRSCDCARSPTACSGIWRRRSPSLKPDFEARDLRTSSHQELAALRGRELPGLLNSYFFYGFMARHVEMWRPVIEDARAELYDAARDAGIALADDAFPTYPAMAACVRAVGDYLPSRATL